VFVTSNALEKGKREEGREPRMTMEWKESEWNGIENEELTSFVNVNHLSEMLVVVDGRCIERGSSWNEEEDEEWIV